MQLNSNVLDDYHIHHSPEVNVSKPGRVDGILQGLGKTFSPETLSPSPWWTFFVAKFTGDECFQIGMNDGDIVIFSYL